MLYYVTKHPRTGISVGFSLLELLTSVAIIGILTAVAIPVYSGYIRNAHSSVIKDQLRAVHLQQQEYFSMYNRYFSTGDTCDIDQKNAINNALFSGDRILQDDQALFCITQENDKDFTAISIYNNGNDTDTWSIDHQGNHNF